MEEAKNRGLTQHEEIIGGMAEKYQQSLAHVEAGVKQFEPACEDRVRQMAVNERDNTMRARNQFEVEYERKPQSVADGVLAHVRSAYAGGDRQGGFTIESGAEEYE